MTAPLLFCTSRYEYMRAELAEALGAELGEITRRSFPDGERYLRLETDPVGRDVALLGGTASDAETLEIYDLACGIEKYGARRLSMIVPYFGYSTMERASLQGEIVTAKTRARLLSSVPSATARVILLDLHSEGIPHYFEGNVRPIHAYAKPVIVEMVQAFGAMISVVACTDAGRAKWVEALANDLSTTASFVFKKRLDGRTTKITSVSAAVEGKRVVIYDDMIRTGGSLLDAAAAYIAAGATEVSAVATHGLFPEDALDRIVSSGLIRRLACTNSHPRAVELASPSLVIRSVADVLARAF